MLKLIEQHPTMVSLLAIWVMGVITLIVAFKMWKVRRMMELDRAYKRYENGQLVEDGRTRSVWDYNFFPGLSKVWHMSQWQPLIAILTLVILALAFMFTKDERIGGIVGVNLGVVLGMLLKKA
jgi:hypothetical protein